MGSSEKIHSHQKKSETALPSLFLSEADADREMMQMRWRMGRQADAAERMRRLEIIRDVVGGKLGDEQTLNVLRQTTALKNIIRQEGWSIQTISQLESLIYGVCDAHASLDSPLWKGQLAPLSMRLASKDETAHYCPDPSTQQVPHAKEANKTEPLRLMSGERLVAEDAESQAVLDFMQHYLTPESDAPNAMHDFHRDLRIKENYAERAEHALEAAFTMLEIARSFAKTLADAQNAQDAKTRGEFSDLADELLMEFNLQRYGLLALLRTSHWRKEEGLVHEDRDFVQRLSRDLLVHALAEQSYALPTTHQLHAMEYQDDKHPSVESYFSEAYAHIERVLGIRPHRDRVTQVPAVDEAQIDTPQGRLH